MQNIRLGRTGLSVPRLGFGGIPIQRVSKTDAVNLLTQALDSGITFFDTARGYADSEEKMGAAFHAARDRVVIATKAQALDAPGMARAIDASLKALRTDYIDLYQLHNPTTAPALQKAVSPGGALAALHEAKQAGKVRHIGITSHSPDLLKRVAREMPDAFETVQVPFNFVGDESGLEILPLALEADMGFIAMKPMGGGALDRPDLALRYVLEFDGVVAIPGMSSVGELEQNLALAEERRPLDEAEKRVLARLKAELGKFFCRKCEYCQPCPGEVKIPLVLAASTFFKRFNNEMLAGWCSDVVRGALECTKCGECEEKCPYHLPIRELLEQNIALFKSKAAELGIPWKAE